MKKLIVLLAVVASACSPSDNDGNETPTGSVEVLSHSYETRTVLGGFNYKHTVTVSNGTDSEVSGNVILEYNSGNGFTSEYVPIVVPGNDVVTTTGNWGIAVHPVNNRVADNVYFAED